jgi:hypothetical protein
MTRDEIIKALKVEFYGPVSIESEGVMSPEPDGNWLSRPNLDRLLDVCVEVMSQRNRLAFDVHGNFVLAEMESERMDQELRELLSTERGEG